MSSAGATLQGSFSGATGTIVETGFYWGTSEGSLDNELYVDSAAGSSGEFSKELTSLSANTTYYYKAYVLEQVGNSVEYRYGSVRSFTTLTAEAYVPSGWLELPAVTGTEDHVGTFYGSGGESGPRNYTYNYSYTWYGSLWVAYPLAKANTSGSGSTSSWRFNPQFSSDRQISVTSNSYSSCYNAGSYARGHQIPNGDRKNDDTMNLHTYYVTNQTPQLQNKFNGSIWSALENAVRSETNSADTIYVVTGACYRKAGGNESITYLTATSDAVTPQSLPVPNYYWKALLKVSRSGNAITNASAVGFWFEHKNYDNSNYANYTVSVDQIEEWTGFDLFTNLSPGLQSSAESNSSWSAFQNF